VCSCAVTSVWTCRVLLWLCPCLPAMPSRHSSEAAVAVFLVCTCSCCFLQRTHHVALLFDFSQTTLQSTVQVLRLSSECTCVPLW
jgi:hypothetical protein